MMKKILLAALAAALLGLSACGPAAASSTASEVLSASEEETPSASSEEAVPESSEEETEVPSEEDAGLSEALAVPEEFVPAAGLSETFADLEHRSFAYDGKVYTLGETTLQDLIDGGLPFEKSDLNNSGNNVNRNYETGRYNAPINDYNSLPFVFLNTTDGSLTEKECLLSSVRWYTLYVPHEDYQDSLNQEILENLADCGKHVGFSFPLTLTTEQLLANSPDPTEQDEYGNVKYTVDSDVYMGSSGYTFKFNKDTSQLEQVSVTWLP